LRLTLPEGGEPLQFGQGPALPAQLRICDERFFKRCVLYGDIGFAESYLAGEWESPDVTAVIAWFVDNHAAAPTLSGSARVSALNFFRSINRLAHLARPNSRAQAQRNIAAHYDLSNEFFALFLDESMMYSSALWPSTPATLEEAQSAKNEALCRKLRLRPDDHVLEIGSGWGGWAIQAAQRHRCRVTSVTISRRQFEEASRRVAAAGVGDRVQIQLRDFRELSERFDKVVSIEMMEALGHRYLRAFCGTVARALKPDGIAALQFIACPDSRYARFRSGVDFIQKHVFPGSLLLSLNRVCSEMTRAGGFVLHELQDLNPDYARTLQEWRRRFLDALPAVRRQGFDDPFIRKWTYYLSYCEAAFARRNIAVVQAVFTRPNNAGL
jgi:cyclopropane-fatty-acyl-phospholipid synthase